MKRKALKLLSMILTAAMVLSCSLMITFAAEAPGAKVPEAEVPEIKVSELKTALSDSITLTTEEGFEYAIRTKDDTGADIWTWAKDEQYDLENDTVIFKSLTADTEYTFARRAAGTEDVLDTDIQTYKTAAVSESKESDEPAPPESKESDEPAPPESKESNEPAPPESKESDEPAPPESKESDEPAPPESKESNEPAPPESKESDEPAPPESKESDEPAPPESKESDEPAEQPEKAPTPGKPVLVSFTDTEIVVSLSENADKAFGYEFTIDGKTFTAEPTFKDLTPDTDYEIQVRIKADVYDGKEYMESDLSEALTVHTMKAAAPAPKAPVLESRTETSLKVKTETGLEYALKDSDKWLTSGEFTGLKADTAYEIVARTIYDPEKAMASLISEPLRAKTLIHFSYTISGIENDKTYDAGTNFRVDATAAGLDNTSPSIGDTRYRPIRWNWGGKENGYFKDGIYKTEFRITDAGSYKLNVVFGLETFTDKGWVSEGREETASVSFKVVAKEFTIKATSTTGGKLSPSGTLTVLQAKNYTIKMIPDKDYKLAKLLVDGKEVKVKDLKYTFENVGSDHTIHAVFEKVAKLDAPKTGDETPLPLLIGIAAVSLIVIIGAAIFVIRRNAKK